MKQPTANKQTFSLLKNDFDNKYGNLDIEYQGFLTEDRCITSPIIRPKQESC